MMPFPDGNGIYHHPEGADYVPANIELSGMETGLVNTISRECVLKEYVSQMRKDYDYILIDCMPSLGMMTINALAAADSLIIPCQPSFLSAKGLDLLFGSVARVRRTLNPRLCIDAQAIRLRAFSIDGALGPHVIENVMNEEKPNQRERISLRYDMARRYIPQDVPYNKTGEYIMDALKFYQEHREKQRNNRGSR